MRGAFGHSSGRLRSGVWRCKLTLFCMVWKDDGYDHRGDRVSSRCQLDRLYGDGPLPRANLGGRLQEEFVGRKLMYISRQHGWR